MRKIIVIGGRGHVLDVLSAAQLAGFTVCGIYDDDQQLWGRSIADVPVLGPVNQAIHAGLPALIVSGNPRQRQEIARQLDISWATLIHPQAVVDQHVHVERGCIVFEGAVTQPGVRLGAHTIVGAKATVAHDCLVGECVEIAAGVQLAGFVQVGDCATLQAGAIVIPKIQIGRDSVIGAGSVVIRNVAEATKVSGIPAQELAMPSAVLAEPIFDYTRAQTG